MTISRQFGLGFAVVAIIAAIVLLQRNTPSFTQPQSGTPTSSLSRLPVITSPSGFINSEPFALADLVGKKVILVDFWTYSCINCQRTTPYLNAWYDTYRDQGLEIVGVHTPEFDFEKKLENVTTAVKKFGIKYPVVLDNDYGTWTAFGNRYWPRKYLIDIEGNIVYDHIGEGGYDETEEKIRELLAARAKHLGEKNGDVPMANVGPVEVAADGRLSPETYFGASRNASTLGNGKSSTEGIQTFAIYPTLLKNKMQLGGTWNIAAEFAETQKDSEIIYRFEAKRVYFVAESSAPRKAVLLLDGKPLGVAAGADVVIENGKSVVTFSESRLYDLVKLPYSGEHVLQIQFQDGGVRVYTFTFG